jgi:osmotically-inducible protein OsmY
MQELTRPSPSRRRPAAATVAALALFALAACDRPAPSQTAGQRIDNATARAEQKAEAAKDSAKSAGNDAARATERAGAEVSDKVKDAAITTAVNAKIAQDKDLSVMRINVDTVGGRVLLRGTAPNSGAAERAQQIASSVDGVVSVDNQLVVSGKG